MTITRDEKLSLTIVALIFSFLFVWGEIEDGLVDYLFDRPLYYTEKMALAESAADRFYSDYNLCVNNRGGNNDVCASVKKDYLLQKEKYHNYLIMYDLEVEKLLNN